MKLKFGKRYFIELLNYFHMDIVLYNLMNLLFVELGDFLSFFNLMVAVVMMVFFIYFYIVLFVIISDNSKDFLLTNLCDPEGRLGLIKKDEEAGTVEGGPVHNSAENVMLAPVTVQKVPIADEDSVVEPINKSNIDESNLSVSENQSKKSKGKSRPSKNNAESTARGLESMSVQGPAKLNSTTGRPIMNPMLAGKIAPSKPSYNWKDLYADVKIRKYKLPEEPGTDQKKS